MNCTNFKHTTLIHTAYTCDYLLLKTSSFIFITENVVKKCYVLFVDTAHHYET